MTRAYLRLDPNFFERKAIDQGYPLPVLAAFIGCLCLADSQPQRGVFRDEKVLRTLLGPAGRYLPQLIERGDLVRDGSRIRVDGWDIWQEGDVTVADRMARYRNKHRNSGRNSPSDGGRLAEALAVQSVSGGGAPSRAPSLSHSLSNGNGTERERDAAEGSVVMRSEPMTPEAKAAEIEKQRSLLTHPHPAVARAAQKALDKLEAL
jgi:hypothetical protein